MKRNRWVRQIAMYYAGIIGRGVLKDVDMSDSKKDVEDNLANAFYTHDKDGDGLLKAMPSARHDCPDTQRITHNCALVNQAFNLDDEYIPLIEYLVYVNISKELRTFLSNQFFDGTSNMPDYFEKSFGLSSHQINTTLHALQSKGLISDTALHCETGLSLPAALLQSIRGTRLTSIEDIFAPLLIASEPPTLKPSDYTHMDLHIMTGLIEAHQSKADSGLNILLYGAPGTGKTQLARLLAKHINANLYEARSLKVANHTASEDFDSRGNSRLRVRYLSFIQPLLANTDSSMLVVDECESIFREAGWFYSKDTMHRLLESNTVPIIWITNHVDCIEESYLRRFTYIKELSSPPTDNLETLANTLFKGLRTSKDFQSQLVLKDNLTPSHLSNAALVAKKVAVKGQQAGSVITEVIDNTLTASGLMTSELNYQQHMAFNADFINVKEGQQQLKTVIQSIKHGSPIRVLLTGPPGTGKTAFAHHLANTSAIELKCVRTSDILSKWVGEAEQNVAKLFKSAQRDQQALLLDEVDSLLVSRQHVSAHHEVQLINELLTHIECFNQPLFAATNFAERLDKAVLRRFDVKLTLEYLTEKQAIRLFKRTLKTRRISQSIESQLRTLKQLTPGDFAIITRQQRFNPDGINHQQAFELLSQENKRKQSSKAIGFIH